MCTLTRDQQQTQKNAKIKKTQNNQPIQKKMKQLKTTKS